MKKFLCFLSALALLLSALPFQLISLADAAADNSQEKFNLFSANSYYWKKANWSDSNSLANGQLVLYNGIYVYAGYELSNEKVTYVVNHNSSVSGSYDIYLRSNVDYDSIETSTAAIQSGDPILIRYSLKDKEFLIFEGSYASSNVKAKMWIDLTDNNDHTVEIITDEDAGSNTTKLRICVDGKFLTDYTNADKPDYCVFDGIKGSGNIALAQFVNQNIAFKGLYIDGVTYDPYYTESFVADFENAGGLTVDNVDSGGAQASVSTAAAHSGTASVYLDDSSSGTVRFALDTSSTQKALKPDTVYRVTAWVKAVDKVGKNINFSPKAVSGRNSVSGAAGNIEKAFSWWGLNNNWATLMDKDETGDWCKVLITDSFTVDTDRNFPVVSIWATGAGSGWYIDDVAFETVMSDEPAVPENTAYGTVSYTNYLKLNSNSTPVDTVPVCVGDSITATAAPASGYRFTGWYKGGNCVSQSVVYKFITDGIPVTARFEKLDSSHIYQGWEQQGADGFEYKVAQNSAGAIITDTVSHTGSYSVKVAENNGQANYLFSCSDNTTPALEAGKEYQAFIWVKPSETGRMNIQLYGVADRNSNANTTRLASIDSAAKSKITAMAAGSTGDGWYRVCIGCFTAVENRPYVSIYCWVSNGTDFEWYYDDLELIALEDGCSVQDFENIPANFSMNSGSAAAAVTDTEAISGNHSLMIKTGDSGSNVFTALFDNSVSALETGSSYRLTMWLKIKQADGNLNFKLNSVDTANDCTAKAIDSFADEQITKGRLATYYTNKAGVKYYGVDSNTATDWYRACITDYYVSGGKYAKLYIWVPANTEFYIDKIEFTKINTVTVNVEGAGRVSASNGLTYKELNSASLTLSAGISAKETVHLTALADKGHTFAGWYRDGALVCSDTAFDVIPEESLTYTAVFEGSAPVYDEITSESISQTLTTGDAATVTNEQFINEALLSTGNSDRIAAAMKKAANGEAITVGFIGGSITEGSGASDKTKSWAYTVYNWFTRAFPESNIEYVNAAIAGSYSRLGVTYTETQLMAAEPDIVFIDYSVNDGSGMYMDSYETIIRTVLAGENRPGLAMIDFTRKSTDQYSYYNQELIYDALGVYYGLPIINIHSAITPFFESGLLNWSDYSDDSIHPNDTGHAMVAAAVINYLEQAKAYSEESVGFAPAALKENWYYAESELYGALMSYADQLNASAVGFTPNGSVSRFGWTAYSAAAAGAELTFNLKNCNEAVIVYGQSGAVLPSDMEIYVNGELYTTVSPVKDSTPWCVASITSVEAADMEIRIVALENSVCNIAGVYAAIDDNTANAARSLRSKIGALSELDLDTADTVISSARAALSAASDDTLAFVNNAQSVISSAESAVSDIKSLVNAENAVNTAEITSAVCDNGVITLISGVDAKQYNSFASLGFTVNAYGVAVIPTAKLGTELKKTTDKAETKEYEAFGKRTLFKTNITGVNTEKRMQTELTARSYVTYTRNGIAVSVYADTFAVAYSANR